MSHSQAVKDALRKSYIFDGQSLALAAALADVSYGTAQRWKNAAKDANDDWDKVKIAHSMAGGDLEDLSRQILTDFVIQFKSTMDTIRESVDIDPVTRVELLTSLADSYNKAISANRKMLPETSKLAVAMEVLERLVTHLKQHKPELLAAFMDVLEPFGEMLAKELK